MSGVFIQWQPIYAERRIATFPVGEAKKPSIRGWQKVGLKGSGQLAAKFNNAEAFGYVTGGRSNVTVLDIDTTDEKVVEDAIQYHGQPVIITRTASGKSHLLYRYNGERRHIRPWNGLPIDVLGDNGYALAAPSKLAKGSYEIIHGHLDDLDRLKPMVRPPMREASASALEAPQQQHRISQGERNQALFEHCHRYARHCKDFDALLDMARTFNMKCEPPMSNQEVFKTVRSVWDWRQDKHGQHGTFVSVDEVNKVLGQAGPDALALWTFLRGHNGPNRSFLVTNTLSETFKWDRRRLAAARSKLVELNELQPLRQAGKGFPALYCWAK